MFIYYSSSSFDPHHHKRRVGEKGQRKEGRKYKFSDIFGFHSPQLNNLHYLVSIMTNKMTAPLHQMPNSIVKFSFPPPPKNLHCRQESRSILC